MTPRAAGIIDACRAARDALHLALAEAERAAAIPDLDPDDAAFTAARLDQLRKIAAGLERRITETKQEPAP